MLLNVEALRVVVELGAQIGKLVLLPITRL